MQPTLAPKPFHRDGWVYEEKVDGYRILAYNNGIDHARRYPDVAVAIARLPVSSLVLDGELAVFDAQLRSRFDWLRHRQPSELATPPVLTAFAERGTGSRSSSRIGRRASTGGADDCPAIILIPHQDRSRPAELRPDRQAKAW
jgi:hypothetical protein